MVVADPQHASVQQSHSCKRAALHEASTSRNISVIAAMRFKSSPVAPASLCWCEDATRSLIPPYCLLQLGEQGYRQKWLFGAQLLAAVPYERPEPGRWQAHASRQLWALCSRQQVGRQYQPRMERLHDGRRVPGTRGGLHARWHSGLLDLVPHHQVRGCPPRPFAPRTNIIVLVCMDAVSLCSAPTLILSRNLQLQCDLVLLVMHAFKRTALRTWQCVCAHR